MAIQSVKGSDNNLKEFSEDKLRRFLSHICEGLECVDQGRLYDATVASLSDMVSTVQVYDAAILAACGFMSEDPEYDTVAARIQLRKMRREVFGKSTKWGSDDADSEYRLSLYTSLNIGMAEGRLSNELRDSKFHWSTLYNALRPERDELFKFIGLDTLYKKYVQRDSEGRITELPQVFWMRVAMGLCYNEDDPTKRAIEFYDVLSQLLAVSSTPTLLQSGTVHPQMSSCYLTSIDDTLESIYKGYLDNAYLSKWSGGIGTDWSNLRATGSMVKSAGIESQGVIPFLKIENDSTVAIARSGKRKGARVAYLATWHLDIEDFLDLRKETGDERRRTHDLHTANWIPDLFMKRVGEDKDWTLFSPDDVPGLHESYGEDFDRLYEAAEEKTRTGEIKLFKVVKARDLWRKMITRLFETGHAWNCFSTPFNLLNRQRHEGSIHSSNLCCVSKDERVVTNEGIVTVEELYEKQTPVTVSGRGQLEQGSVMYLPRPDAPMVRIHTKEGFQHKVTPDHKVWVVDKGRVEAQELLPGDKIELQTVSQFGNHHEPELAFLMGLIAGDGTFGPNARIDLWEGKTVHLKDEVEKCVASVIEKHYTPTPAPTPACTTPTFKKSKHANKVSLNSAALAQVLDKFGFDKATKHSIPDVVWKGTQETQEEYLRGLYLTDGTTACTNRGGSVFVCIAQTHKELLQGVQLLWLNLGVKSSLTLMRPEGTRSLPDGKGGHRDYVTKDIYKLTVTSKEGCSIVEDVTGIARNRGNEDFLDVLNSFGRSFGQSFNATFTHLEDCPNEDAYCLNVDSDDHVWTVNGIISSNTEIALNTAPDDECAVCNLSSINLSRLQDSPIPLSELVKTVIRMLDNVIDINFYPIPEARKSNLRHRPIGLGTMGLQDYLWQLELPFDSPEALEEVGGLYDDIQFYAINASVELAKERGSYETFQGSPWSEGELTPDSMRHLKEYREKIGVPLETVEYPECLVSHDWECLSKKVKQYGIRNSNLTAIAPTVSIGTIAGVIGPCIEPAFSNMFVETNMKGEFIVVNSYLVEALKRINLWNERTREDIKVNNGSIQTIDYIPQHIRNLYKTAFEIDQRVLIDLAAVRVPYIDQSQSLNLFYAGNSGAELSELYQYAWRAGLKSTYYLRTMAASNSEKVTVNMNRVDSNDVVPMCRIDNPDCEACQ